MFRIESYITSIILSYVDRYIKNFRQQDAQVSLWEGDGVFQNLNLDLDVLEQELNLPFSFVSGHIHELRIHVPWTRLTSESVQITINTIECVMKLKPVGSHQSQAKIVRRDLQAIDDPQSQSLRSSLVNKIICNLSVTCNNLILKYVEEDIVLSMNIKTLSFGTVNSNWEPAFIELSAAQLELRKLISLSDVTVCLDKRNASGRIETYLEPLLYRCFLTARLWQLYGSASARRATSTRLHVLCQSMVFTVSQPQIPMILRLAALCLALQRKQLSNHSLAPPTASGESPATDTSDHDSADGQADDQVESWSSWALSWMPQDYARYSKDEELDDMERDLGDEYGWKQVHGDVFRPATNAMLFSALIGAGYQVTVVTLSVIIFAIMGELYTERGSLLSTAIFVYAATSPVNGYFGGGLYARLGGKIWIKQMILSAFMLPALVCGTAFFINFIAIYYHASRAIPFGTMVAVTCICFFVILPLTMVGTVLGRNLAGQPDYPCRINAVPRPIPEKKWFMEPAVIVLLGGVLPFGSIFIEMYFIFTSFWAYKIYYVYGFMLLVFLILMIVTVCVTIVCTYFLLNAEDYRWQWTSFLAAASTSGYVYMYSFYYFFFKTKMYGLFQTAFYFGYMALFSAALGVMCGTVGYVGTSLFVRKIYSTVKID